MRPSALPVSSGRQTLWPRPPHFKATEDKSPELCLVAARRVRSWHFVGCRTRRRGDGCHLPSAPVRKGEPSSIALAVIVAALALVSEGVIIVASTRMEMASHAREAAVGVVETHALRRAASVAYPSSSLEAVGTLSPMRPSALPDSSGRRALWLRPQHF